jgi:hypothetical protein
MGERRKSLSVRIHTFVSGKEAMSPISGGVHSRQLYEDEENATLSEEGIRDLRKLDNDDHLPKTELLCLENRAAT